MNATVTFTQTVKKATSSMATTQHNSDNSLTPKKKGNNLVELINIPTKAEERSMIQISFRTQDPNIRQAQSGIRAKNYS